MPEPLVCPDVQQFERLCRGELSLAEVEQLAQHVEQCRACAERVQGSALDDTLIEAVRASSTATDPADRERVADLMDRLKRLPFAYTSDTATTAAFATPPAGAAGGEFIVNTQASDIALSPPQAPGEIGRLGGYRVLKMLGAGGMGMVYQAEDVQLQRPIALKVMKAEVATNPDNRERFLREARAAAKLKSDHVVNIYQVGEERQIVFLAMEFLEGMSLADWLKKGRKPSLAQAARIGRQIALGLADAHACGLIHRDIKPGNIWLDSSHQGRVKLLDFGLARGDSEEVQLTQSGAIVGTPAYMAPEQARGEKVDPRCDLFSLGVVLYRLMTGQMPFRGDNTMSILTALAMDTPKPPREINPDIPPQMAALIDCLLAKDREKRPAKAKVVADELAAIEREATQQVTQNTVPFLRAASLSGRPAQIAPVRTRLRWLVAASLLLLGGVAAAIVVIIRDKQGNKIAEMEVPPGGKIEIQDNGKGKAEAKAPPAPKQEVKIAAAPLAPLLPGEPLAPTALVQRPAKLPGVRSWSILTRNVWNPTTLAYQPDGKRLAVGSEDGSIRIWEPQTGRLVQVLLGRSGVRLMAWSPDGRSLAVASAGTHQRQVQLRDADGGRLLRTLELLLDGDIRALAWTPDGRRVLAGCGGPNQFAWNVEDGKLVRDLQQNLRAIPIAFSPDGKWLAGIREDTPGVFLWDAESGKPVRKLIEGKGFLPSGVWSPDGKHLACAATDGVRVYHAQTGQEIFHYKDASDGAHLCWSPDGRALAISRGHEWGTAVVEVGKEGKRFELDAGDSLVAWSPDGKTIARAYINYESQRDAWAVRLYDSSTGKQQRSLSEASPVSGFAWSPTGQAIAVMAAPWGRQGSNQCLLSSADTGQTLAVLKDATGALAWSPDGKRIATGGPPTSGDSRVLLWDTAGKLLHRLADPKISCPAGSLAWSPDGKQLASTFQTNTEVILWDTEKGTRLRELGPFPNLPDKVSWLPDGRLAFGVPNTGWHFWEVEQDKLVNDPKQWNVTDLHFTPDGRAALMRPDFHHRLRDLATGKDRGGPLLNGTWVDPPIAWSPHGDLVAQGVSATVELWRVPQNRRVRTLCGSSAPDVHQVAFSPDGKLLAGRAGERLYFWEVDTGRPRGILLASKGKNALTVITPDGHYTGAQDVERSIVMVVQKDDGTQEVLEPADFEQKYGFKNDPDKVHLLKPLPPPPYPLPGMPMGPQALVREPAQLPDAASWTIETVNPRGLVKAAAYRPDGKLLATGGEDGAIRIWDPANSKLVRILVGDPVLSLSWSKDGKVLAAAVSRNHGEVVLWEVDAGRPLRRLAGAWAAWSPKGQTLALRAGGLLQLWDAAAKQIARKHEFPGYGSVSVWSPDGSTLAVGLSDKSLRLWDAASGKETRKLEGHQGVVVGAAWSPDGKRLVSIARGERDFRVWDAVSGKLQGKFAVDNVWDMEAVAAWSPDGKAVAFGFNHEHAPHGLFDPATGRPLRSLDAGRYVTALAFSPDGKQVATAGSDGVRLHDAAAGKRTHTLEERTAGHPRIVSPIRSPDGSPLGVRLRLDAFGQLAVTADGHYRGNARVDRLIRMVVQKRDGTTETLTPGAFEQKYGFKNDPERVRLMAE